MDLRAKPFYLSDEDIAWVEDTLASMTLEEKVGQMFCVTDTITDVEELQAFVKRYHPGGFMYRCGDAQEIQSAQRAMQAASRIPLLLACNLESGGNGVAVTGTFFGREMEVAATGETEQARRLGVVCAREGAAAGCNWAFSPIVDIDYNWRNPITNVRTFGSDPDMVIEMSKAFMDGVRETGADLAVTIKHFPGDGVDELLEVLSCWLPEGPQLFPDDMVTDQPERQIMAEIVREKLLRDLDKEIPHGTAVEVTKFSQRDNDIIDCHVTIYCEKESHKGIIIGKKGAMLKKISTQAREDLETFMGAKVYLETWVKVKENWRDNLNAIQNFGYTED